MLLSVCECFENKKRPFEKDLVFLKIEKDSPVTVLSIF